LEELYKTLLLKHGVVMMQKLKLDRTLSLLELKPMLKPNLVNMLDLVTNLLVNLCLSLDIDID
jgi:hypothetical protein